MISEHINTQEIKVPAPVKEQLEGIAFRQDKILNQLLKTFDVLDFKSLANPQNIENFKLSDKHYLILSIQYILDTLEIKDFGLCKKQGIIYLFNGTYWSELDNETFQKFLGEASEKMGVPKFLAEYYRFKECLYKQFLSTAYLKNESRFCR